MELPRYNVTEIHILYLIKIHPGINTNEILSTLEEVGRTITRSNLEMITRGLIKEKLIKFSKVKIRQWYVNSYYLTDKGQQSYTDVMDYYVNLVNEQL